MNMKTFTMALLAGIASAAPTTMVARQTNSTVLGPDAKFGLMAIRSGSAIQYAGFDAAKQGLLLNLPAMNASCDGAAATYATFYLNNGGLFLYAGASATPQQLYVDDTGMGQGVIQYTTGAESAPKDAQRTNFTLDAQNVLTFNGKGFVACPNSIDGAWSVWADTGVSNPAGLTGCLDIAVKAIEIANPQGCVYTQ